MNSLRNVCRPCSDGDYESLRSALMKPYEYEVESIEADDISDDQQIHSVELT